MSSMSLPLVRTAVGATPSAQAHVRHTGAEGLDIARVPVDVAGFEVPVYATRPADSRDASLPVVLLLSESFGMHPYIEDVARRLSHVGTSW